MKVMTKEDKIQVLQDWVSKNHIINIKNLELACKDDGIDPYEDVLSPMNYNTCDKCGDLYPSEELCWLDCIDWEDDNPDDRATLRGINAEDPDYCALCWECLAKLKEKGKHID